MRAKSILLLLLALGCGLVASIGITQVMATRDSGAPATVETETIFVAMKDIAMGDPITAQMVKLEPWPKDKVPIGALSKLEEVEGRKPRGPIPAGSPIVEKHLVGKGLSEAGPGEIIPAGYRVAPVKVDPVMGNANMLRPSDRVDVLVHVKQDPGKGITRTVTRTILQDIKVFAVNDQFDVATTSGEKSVTARTIWLLVTPEQAEAVTLAAELGQVRLVMRSPTDKEQPKLEGKTPRALLEEIADADPPAEEPATTKPAAEPGVNKLLDLLGASAKPEPKPVVTAAAAPRDPNASWTIRIISGPQITDAVLEREGASDGGSGATSQRWKISSSSNWSAPMPSAAKSLLPAPRPNPAGGAAEPDAGNPDENENNDATEKKPVATAANMR